MADLRVGEVKAGRGGQKYVYVGGSPKDRKSWATFESVKDYLPKEASFIERVGRGVSDVTQGIKQLGLQVDEAISPKGAPDAPKLGTADEYTAQVEDEISSYESANPGFDGGRMLGNVGATAPAGLLGGGAGLMSILRAGASGAAAGGAQFVPEDGSRAVNAGAGGILGAGVQTLPAGFAALKNAAKPSPTMAAAADDAMNLGVRPTPAQATGSRTLQRLEMGMENTAGGGLAMEQLGRKNQRAINREIAKKLGSNSETLDREVLGRARDQASKWYDFALKGETFKADQVFTSELDDIVKKFNPPGAELGEDVMKRINALKALTSVDATDYQAARSAIGRDAVSAYRAGNSGKAMALDALQEAYDDLAARNLPSHKLDYFNKARERVRILKTVEKAADPTSGNISTQKLVNAIRQKDPGFYYYGKGDNPLAEVTNAGYFLKSGPDSGTASRAGSMLAPGVLGGAYGYTQGGPEGAMYGMLAGTALPYALTKGYLGLTAPQGILGAAAQRGLNYAIPAAGGLLAGP